jgi:hypothetical protein
MANEIQITASLAYTNGAQNIAQQILGIAGSLFSITGKNFEEGTMAVPTTSGGTAIPVANLSTLGWAIFKNNDPSNYISLISAVSGTEFCRLLPGEVALFRFDPGITAPAAIAHTAVALLQYLILEI